MKIAPVLARHRHLLALLGVSLLIHMLAIELIATRAARSASGQPRAPSFPLAVRLQGASAGAEPRQRAPAPRAAGRPAPPPIKPAHKVRVSRPGPGQVLPAAPSPASLSRPALPAAAGVIPAPGEPGEQQMPGRYRVRMPPAARLSYAVSRARPGQALVPDGSARIEWRNDGDRYRMSSDGVTGRLSSEGGSSDAGIAPAVYSEQLANGTLATTRFDDSARRIVFSTSSRSYPINTGSQDRASVLMQLAGIGLAEPDQIQDVIEIFVGGAEDAGVARFQVLGREDLASALGMLATWHLVQLAPPGQARLELWLAPDLSWYPVQLRVTGADGAVSNQLITRIDPVDAGAAPGRP